jgi:hypothetical protein
MGMRDRIIRALARGDGQMMSGFDAGHTGEVMYGGQADQIELLVAACERSALERAAAVFERRARELSGTPGDKNRRRELHHVADWLRREGKTITRKAQERYAEQPEARRRAAANQALALVDPEGA